MKRKDAIMRDCKHQVATALRFESWEQLNRFRTQTIKTKHHKMAEAIYLIDMPILFANWWFKKANQPIPKVGPTKQDLEEFLNADV